jgi:RimJ/RimL family protein N-acetyltransferase
VRIECGDVCIRSYRVDDLEALVRYADNPRVAMNLRDHFPHPYTPEHAEEWLYAGLRQDPEVNFALATDEELIGSIGLKLGEDVYEHSAEVGYWLGEPYWGRGIATQAVRAFSDWAFASFGLLRLHAYVFGGNVASMRVLEKAGYQREGCQRQAVVKFGRVMDQFLYGRLAPEGDD